MAKTESKDSPWRSAWSEEAMRLDTIEEAQKDINSISAQMRTDPSINLQTEMTEAQSRYLTAFLAEGGHSQAERVDARVKLMFLRTGKIGLRG